jgi:hypothetical protein
VTNEYGEFSVSKMGDTFAPQRYSKNKKNVVKSNENRCNGYTLAKRAMVNFRKLCPLTESLKFSAYTCVMINPLNTKKKSTIRYIRLSNDESPGFNNFAPKTPTKISTWKITVSNAAIPRNGVRFVRYLVAVINWF